MSVGFAAPTALAAMTFSAYFTSSLFGEVPNFVEQVIAVSLLLLLSAVHSSNHRNSGRTQTIFTTLKVVVILLFIFGGLFLLVYKKIKKREKSNLNTVKLLDQHGRQL